MDTNEVANESASVHRDALAKLGWRVGPLETIDGEPGFWVEGPGPRHARTFDAMGRLRVVRVPR